MFGEATERFDAIDMALTTSELVLVAMNPLMVVTIGYQPIAGLPSIGVDIAA